MVAFPVAVGALVIKNNGRQLQAGDSLITFPTLEGPEEVPEAAWEVSGEPATTLQRAQRLIPGFLPSQGNHEEHQALDDHEHGKSKQKREKEEKKHEGEVLLVIQNHTPDQISLRGSRDERLVFHLRHEAFARGEFKYDLVIEAKKVGKVDVKGYVIPFLAPVGGQEFSTKALR